jgi:mono/diheme cytochrome c family protein
VLTLLLIVVLVVIALVYAAVPLLVPKQVDPLPDERDPVLLDLEEDREALFRAIRELDARDDVEPARREQLRARYEAKAAAVLRAIDERQAALAGAAEAPAAPRRARGLPWGAIGLLGLMAASALALGPFVLPRVGQSATVTTFFADDLRAAEALRDLQRAAERDPSVANLMALGDAYWRLEDAGGAETSYRRVLLAAQEGGVGDPPALAYQRLALLAIQDDLALARDYLLEARRVDPTDPETLFGLGELAFATGDLALAADAFRAFLATPQGLGDPEVEARLQLVERLAPALEALEAERTHEALAEVAEVFWTEGAPDAAVEIYFEVLTEHDPFEPVALSRTGQLLFMRGRADDAIALIERAAESAGGLEALEPQASLFLGNAYFGEGDDQGAIRAWRAHVTLVGREAAGRVPGLIEAAEARLAGEAPAEGALPEAARPAEAPPADAEPSDLDTAAALDDPALLGAAGSALFAEHCSVCHGAQAGGGVGPRLLGNPRAGQEANVRSAITFGRGIMPGFGPLLTTDQIEVLVRWLATEVATPR